MRIASAALVAAIFAVSSASAELMMHKSLYERLGGIDAIRAVVDDFVANVAADKRINTFFAATDIARLKRNLVSQICQGTGGPCVYTGRSMKEVHAGMGVRTRHFNALSAISASRSTSSRCRRASSTSWSPSWRR